MRHIDKPKYITYANDIIYVKMDIYKLTIHQCGCGYRTGDASNANKHKKVVCGHQMIKKEMRFVNEECFHLERPSELLLKECLQREKALLEEREDNLRSISQLSNNIDRLKSSLEKMAKSVDIIDTEDDFDDTQHAGLIYFIIDKDIQGRGKIGRTKNTNVNKLKTRYAIFGNPSILCFLSTDIKSDENALKKLMRDAGCMESNKEMISNCEVARGVFYEFMTSRVS